MCISNYLQPAESPVNIEKEIVRFLLVSKNFVLTAFYKEAKGLKSRGVAGGDALVAELAPLFARETPDDNEGPI